MASSLTQQPKAIRINVYRNGDAQYPGKRVVINRRTARAYDQFLQDLTDQLKWRQVKRLTTPNQGKRTINSLDDFQPDENYVAVANERFKKLNYPEIASSIAAQRSPRQSESGAESPPRLRRIQVSGRHRKVRTAPFVFNVFPNGKFFEQSRKIMIPFFKKEDREYVMREVTDKVMVSDVATGLYTLEGKRIPLKELEDHQFYVAVGRAPRVFKPGHYGLKLQFQGAGGKTENISRKYEAAPPPVRRGPKSQYSSQGSGNSSSTSNKTDSTRPAKSRNEQPSRSERPKQQANKQKKEEEDVFHAKPVKHKRSSEKTRSKPEREDSGVFKAKGENRETKGAEEVEETKDTHVDLPIDQVEAEEVQDEEIEGEKEEQKTNAKKEKKREKTKSPQNPKKTPTPEPQKRKTPTPEPEKRRTPTPEKAKSRTPTPQQERPKSAQQKQEEEKKPEEQEDKKSEENEKAATTIQAGYRGHKARQETNQMKAEKAQQEEANSTEQPAAEGAPQAQGEADGTAKEDDQKDDNKEESSAKDGASSEPAAADATKKK